jgi:hypothetical protein
VNVFNRLDEMALTDNEIDVVGFSILTIENCIGLPWQPQVIH